MFQTVALIVDPPDKRITFVSPDTQNQDGDDQNVNFKADTLIERYITVELASLLLLRKKWKYLEARGISIHYVDLCML